MFPEGASSIAGEVDQLFTLIHLVAGLAGLAVAVWIIDSIIRYRHSRPRTPAVPPRDGNRGLIITLATSFLVLAAIGVWSQVVWDRINVSTDIPIDTIRIAPRQFQWDVTYAGADRAFGTDDDRTWINRLVLPLNRPVRIELRSTDVIHSFFIPEFRIKRDAVPGTLSVINLTATRAGTYDLVCTEYCGLGHYRMQGVVEVVEDYRGELGIRN